MLGLVASPVPQPASTGGALGRTVAASTASVSLLASDKQSEIAVFEAKPDPIRQWNDAKAQQVLWTVATVFAFCWLSGPISQTPGRFTGDGDQGPAEASHACFVKQLYVKEPLICARR